jgi:glycosyltransferase involved in cell wall biosynthesis
MTANERTTPSICFVGLGNLPVLAREYARHGAGGAELQQTLLAKALAGRGLRVSMIVADYGQSDGAVWDGIKTYKAYRPDEGIPVLRFLHPRWTKLWAALRRADADIYYVSCAGALLGQVALFARVSGRKLVFRIASNSDCDPAALLIRFARDKSLYRFGLERADLVLAQTPQQQEALLRNFHRPSRVVASLIESAGPRNGFQNRDIGVLWVGNLRPLKRPDRLLEAARRLPGIRFHMIGGPMPNHERFFETVRRQAADVANVQFHGPVPYHEIGAFYERARVFAGTSEVEGFPNTYLQAWMRGTPVVAFLDPEALLTRKALGRRVTSIDELCATIEFFNTHAAEWEAVSIRTREYMDARCNSDALIVPYVEALAGLS